MVCIEEAIEQDPDNGEIIRIKRDIEYFKSKFERLKGTKKSKDNLCQKKIEKLDDKLICAQRMTEEGYGVIESALPAHIIIM